jgi:hydrogenase nickel incorporation protein HypA/HybF
MHEMSICESILEHIERICVRENASKVKKVALEIGCFAGVENEALYFCFDAITKGTIAENAILEIIEQNGSANCFECSENFVTSDRLSLCPKCGSGRIMVNGGDALRIKNLEVV